LALPENFAEVKSGEKLERPRLQSARRITQDARGMANKRSRYQFGHRKFREWVLDQMHWSDGKGIAVPGSLEAYTYLQGRNYDLSTDEPTRLEALRVWGADPWLVLLQTDHVDIVATPWVIPRPLPSWPSYSGFHNDLTGADIFVFERATGQRVLHDEIGSFASFATVRHAAYLFVEMNREPPPELVRVPGDQPDSEFGVYTLDDGGVGRFYRSPSDRSQKDRPRIDFRRISDSEDCESHIPRPDSEDSRNSFVLCEQALLYLDGWRTGPGEDDRDPPIVERNCGPNAESATIECTLEPVSEVKLDSFDNLFTGGDEGARRENIEFVLENAERLRRHGYVLPDQWLTELQGRFEENND
jgi:hypothetical protein